MDHTIFKTRARSFERQTKAAILRLAVWAMVFTAAAGINIEAASPGALDLSFGTRGTAAILHSSEFKETNAVAVQPDGKILLTGYLRICPGATCHIDIILIRLNPNGTPDAGFGTNGVVLTDFSGQSEAGYALAVQADGKIVVAAGADVPQGGTAQSVLGFKLVRYLTDGTLDSTFGTGGKVYESFDDIGGTPQSLIIQPDGKIVAAGTDNNSMLFIARFNQNGGLDTGFAANGKIASNSYNVLLTKIARQADGKLVVAASSVADMFKLIRFNADGTPDAGFGNNGVVISTFETRFRPAIAIQPDGKILISGDNENYDYGIPPLRRFNSDGSVDAGFVPNHGVTANGACKDCTRKVVRILLLPDGRFYLAGFYPSNNTVARHFSVSRYLSSGALDPSFGFRGTSRFYHSNITSGTENILWRVNDAELQADGKIVMVGRGFLPVNGFGRDHYLALRINAAVTPPGARSDFDGDRKTDFAVFRPSTRFWYALNSTDGSVFGQRFGASGDVLTPGDYNYDLKTDPGVFRPSAASWYISPSLPSGGGNGGGAFGLASDIQVPEDYDGDGYTDLAVFRPSNGTWTIRYSSFRFDQFAAPTDVTVSFGAAADKPVPGDYDGDGKADLAVFRPADGVWYMLRSSAGGFAAVQFGIGTDKTVPADYDGDGRADVAVYRDGVWYVLRSSDGGFSAAQFGIASDKPVPGDYDGDGKSDYAVFRPAEGVWYVLKSSDGTFFGVQWGIAEDTPVPFIFVK